MVATRVATEVGGYAPAVPLDLDVTHEAAADGGLTALLGIGDIEDFDAKAQWAAERGPRRPHRLPPRRPAAGARPQGGDARRHGVPRAGGRRLGGRLELRLNDPGDSLVDRRASQRLAAVAGRGLTPEKLQFQAAVPRSDGVASTEGLGEAVAAARQLDEAWDGPRAPEVQMLPPLVPLSALLRPGADPEPGVPIGLAERDLQPVYLELRGADPHFLVFGDGESGKTTFLRTLVTGVTGRVPPQASLFIVVDYRRTLLDAVPRSHLLGYAGAATEVGRLRELLLKRLPPPDLTPARLRDRSWWSGPEVIVVVDDYDLVVSPPAAPWRRSSTSWPRVATSASTWCWPGGRRGRR